MIIVQLKGGLGNQMFQYAFGKYLASKNNTTLTLDTSFLQSKLPFKRWATQMQYELHIFNINAEVKTNFFSSNVLLYPFAKIEYLLKTRINERRFTLIKENDFGFNERFLNAGDNSYLIGNFQSEKYFKEIENEIRKDFTFKNKLDSGNTIWKNKIMNCNSVSVHIRRGDYISINRNAQKFASLHLDYYYKAIKLIAAKIPDIEIFFFSDDIDWVKDNFKADVPVHFINCNTSSDTAYIDMQLMSYCRHNIIANSTFSWWGAWLNSNQEKIVVAPQKWFEDSSVNSKDIYPPEWIKL